MADVISTSAAPTLSSRAFRRPRLTTQLDAACERTITLICAPPGTGKTTLAAGWAAGRPDLPVVWFDMEVRGNDLDPLYDELTERLEKVGQLASAHRAAHGGSVSLADRLSRTRSGGGDIVVVLDDAHEITDRSVWHDLSRLAAASPPWLHWIIVTRADPPLGIQRLQLQGRLAQIRVSDLAFDVDEATTFMAWFGLDIPADAVRTLVRWSEGWVAALCLAARTMLSEGVETRPWERLGASEALVLDFLIEEVLDRLTPADRRFLLRTERGRPAHPRARHAAHREHHGRAAPPPSRAIWHVPAAGRFERHQLSVPRHHGDTPPGTPQRPDAGRGTEPRQHRCPLVRRKWLSGRGRAARCSDRRLASRRATSSQTMR